MRSGGPFVGENEAGVVRAAKATVEVMATGTSCGVVVKGSGFGTEKHEARASPFVQR